MSVFKKYYPFLFLTLLSFWFVIYQKNGLLSLGDFVFPPIPELWLYFRLFAWKDFAFLGNASYIDYVNLIHYFPIFALFKIGIPITVIQSIFISALFIIGSFAMYHLLHEVLIESIHKKIICMICAILYMFNPYVAIVKLRGYNMSLYAYVFAPLIIYFFTKYIKGRHFFKNKYLYLIGFSYLLSSPASTQPAYITWSIFLIFYFSLLLFLFHNFNKTILLKFLIVITLFFLINTFWIMSLVLNLGAINRIIDVVQDETSLEAINNVSGNNLVNTFRLLGIPGMDATWRGIPYLSYYQIYSSPIFIFVGISLFLITFFGWLFSPWTHLKGKERLWWFYFISISLLSIFIIGGVNFLIPNLKLWLFKNFPLFLLYRKPYEKGAFFFIFSLVGLLAISLKIISNMLDFHVKKRNKNITTIFFIVILFFVLLYNFPFWSKQIFTSINHPECTINSLNHYPNYLYYFGEQLEKDKKVGRLLGLPINNSPISSGVENFKWGYAGIDPIFLFTNKGYILMNPLIPFIKNFYQNINSESVNEINYVSNLSSINSLFNIKKNILRNDICWQLYHSPDPSHDKKYLDGMNTKKTSIGELDLYDVSAENFVPHVYTPQHIIYSQDSVKKLTFIISQPEFTARSAVFFESQNSFTHFKNQLNQLGISSISTDGAKIQLSRLPVTEFKKINPVKYRVIIHGATGKFPFLLNESFHDGWKTYFVKLNNIWSSNHNSKSDLNSLITKYKILDGNEEDQVNIEELKEFVDKGLVTILGNGEEQSIIHLKYENGIEKLDYIEKYKIDFVSKNFQDTIQNDNLPNGSYYETWFAGKSDDSWISKITGFNKSILQVPDDTHLMVNGYANSWIIDPEKICKNNGFCKINDDGSYDLEMVIEFWPQRLFYLGLGISGMTLLLCLIYLIYDFIYKKMVRYRV
ncbi:MAG: hypothetical protein UV73_C0012G0113 [Candidatus Gottesmanbacteria bacterium GW2011_GWA2_43_14]|uniref:Membrane protein 6-pyruvoyl-tetrahydropterin synthase-related domain-containing protein n=1 Tax=Candidatus Gottesmanbacteria bacterium GW2011_GWA2_43_14 TaxID=1618443 RepID=A0A0G1DDY9_9BACT|nr:MAG: hypothetical protein UV73_C0012G0113 [Candidatus Gottesmanbacteria bacterium GW2011_GWA2_43_14]